MRKVYGERGEKPNRIKEQQLTRQEQVTLSRLQSDHHPDLRSWQHKIGRIEESICRYCKMGEEMGEHMMLECPAIHPSIRGQLTDSEAIAKEPRLALKVWERWLRMAEKQVVIEEQH
ncbi:Hypothetical predicted protein [Octopus vulgaris]|uniref:Uncharacterized protein n=1 Tax=Octopus vulgaris TaxID=6645 RepID=A0AA36AUN2_OCTVU|nr:Hypothetical predicted protein [Octopus vulgaris]